MSTLARKHNQEEKELSEDNKVVSLFVVPGGKGPPSDFWVLNCNVGCVFLGRPKLSTNGNRQMELFEYGVLQKIENTNAIRLIVKAPGQEPIPIWYDGISFSNKMEKVATVTEREPSIIKAAESIFFQELNAMADDEEDAKAEEPIQEEKDKGHE